MQSRENSPNTPPGRTGDGAPDDEWARVRRTLLNALAELEIEWGKSADVDEARAWVKAHVASPAQVVDVTQDLL